MNICPFYSEEKKGCTLKRDWGLCVEESDYYKYEYYWTQCEWYLQEKHPNPLKSVG